MAGLFDPPFVFGMRLDVFLKISRLTKSRAIANELCSNGRVQVNDTSARASKEIRTGDRVKINFVQEIVTVEVSKVPLTKQVSKAAAAELYHLVSRERKENY